MNEDDDAGPEGHVRTLAEWVAVWNDQGREFGACAVSGSGLGFKGCASPAVADQVGGVLIVPVLVAVVALWGRRRARRSDDR